MEKRVYELKEQDRTCMSNHAVETRAETTERLQRSMEMRTLGCIAGGTFRGIEIATRMSTASATLKMS